MIANETEDRLEAEVAEALKALSSLDKMEWDKIELQLEKFKSDQIRKRRSLESSALSSNWLIQLIELLQWLVGVVKNNLIKDGQFKKPGYLKYFKLGGVVVVLAFRIYKIFIK